MKFIRPLIAAAALAATALSGTARANELEVSTFGTSAGLGNAYLTVAGWRVGTHFGTEFSPFLARDYTVGKSFVAFCIEPTVDLSTAAEVDPLNTTETYNPITMAASPVTAAKATQIQRLFDFYGDTVSTKLNPVLTDPTNGQGKLWGGAMQLAIWEILYETQVSGGSPIYSIASGNVALLSPAGQTSLVSTTNQMLAKVYSADPVTGPSYATTVWDASGSQDLISNAGVVPEPTTYALIAAGLGVVAFARRRRNPSHA